MTLPSLTPYSLPSHCLLNFPVPLRSVTTPLYLVKEQNHCKLTVLCLSNLFSQPITLFSSWTSSRHPVQWTIQCLPIHQLFSDFILLFQFSSVQSLSHIWLFATPWTAAHQTSLSITNSQSLLKFMFTEPVMPSNHLILCRPFSSHLQSFPASGSFQMSQLFASDGQSIGVSASASALALLFNQLKFHVLLFYFMYLFVLGCAGSSLLHRGYTL